MFHKVIIILAIKLNKNLVQWKIYFIKNYNCNFSDFFLFQIQFYLQIITLRWHLINDNFSSLVFAIKLIHPYSWIHMILTSHHLHIQTYQSILRPTFSNFPVNCTEIQSKLYSIVIVYIALSLGKVNRW